MTIIVKLTGGLGNQMFQYAAGRRLAYQHKTDLLLDISGFASYPLRKYELDIFNIHATIASLDLLNSIEFLKDKPFQKKIKKFFRKNIIRLVKEQTIDFDDNILTLPNDVYLDGYWQSEKYFQDIKNIIKNDFLFVTKPSEKNQVITKKIAACNSVSIHVRRGDYILNPETKQIHHVCDEKYYKTAISMIFDIINEPEFFLFSDDLEWAKKNIQVDAPIMFISHNLGKQSFEDMRLMSYCKNHIIANSSFSWWGAWLAENDEQCVIAPDRWFNTRICNYCDRIPKHWNVVNYDGCI